MSRPIRSEAAVVLSLVPNCRQESYHLEPCRDHHQTCAYEEYARATLAARRPKNTKLRDALIFVTCMAVDAAALTHIFGLWS